jgi:uncharacterized membrane protein (DUF2068 family)
MLKRNMPSHSTVERTAVASHATAPKRRHPNGGLVAIAIFKLLKALLFVAIGIGALKLLHKDIVDVLTRIATDLRFDPDNGFISFLLDKATLITDNRLRWISIGVFSYGTLDIVEGVGLLMEKTWAEYLTLIITASFLPWEIFELLRRLTLFRVSLTFVNALVVLYLLYFVTRQRREHRLSEGVEEPEERIS